MLLGTISDRISNVTRSPVAFRASSLGGSEVEQQSQLLRPFFLHCELRDHNSPLPLRCDRRGDYVQRRVPERLQEAVGRVLNRGERRVFLKKSLGTKSLKEAKAAAPHVLADFNRIVGEAEARLQERLAWQPKTSRKERKPLGNAPLAILRATPATRQAFTLTGDLAKGYPRPRAAKGKAYARHKTLVDYANAVGTFIADLLVAVARNRSEGWVRCSHDKSDCTGQYVSWSMFNGVRMAIGLFGSRNSAISVEWCDSNYDSDDGNAGRILCTVNNKYKYFKIWRWQCPVSGVGDHGSNHDRLICSNSVQKCTGKEDGIEGAPQR